MGQPQVGESGASQPQDNEPPLHAPLEISFDYTRSLGPTLSEFMTGLAGRRILGARASDGRVHAPPFEFDPVTGQPPAELVQVGPVGTVVTWSWMRRPMEGQPLTRPFGWALIRLDGADTALLHAVDVGSAERMQTGMRVTPRWSGRRGSGITDIECFEPVLARGGTALPETLSSGDTPDPHDPDPNGPEPPAARGEPAQPVLAQPDSPTADDRQPEPVTMITTPIRLRYDHTVSPGESAYLRALAQGRLIGQRCPGCHKVYVPPRGACPTCGVPTTTEVELPDTGIVTTFCVVNVPFQGQRVATPYVAASVLIDGADIAFGHLILGCPPEEVRMGMRVAAVWRTAEDAEDTTAAPHTIDHFRPTGEPDAPYDSYAHHL